MLVDDMNRDKIMQNVNASVNRVHVHVQGD